MKVRYLALAPLGVILAMQVGCQSQSTRDFFKSRPHRIVTISLVTPGDTSACEVDFPVALLRNSKHHTIAWAAEDHDYWIYFPNGNPVGVNSIKVPNGGQTQAFNPSTPGYFMYAIYDSDPGPNPSPNAACKKADDDRDTGLNVKR
jgi:hypothetical protein